MTVPGTGPLAVLIVDDETDLAEELALGLGATGLRTLVAASGAEAMDILARMPDIGAVVTDVRMPGTDGFSLARHMLAEARPEQARRVVIMTGHATLDDASAAVRAGAFDYLRKPFDLDAMIGVVSRALESAAGERLAHGQAKAAMARLAQAEAATENLRLQDPLTGLPNALALEKALSALPPGPAALLMLRIEGLRFVTDAGWRSLHDSLLTEAAARFTAEAGRHAVFALHDAAHFAVLAPGATEAEAEALGRALVGALAAPLEAGGQGVALTVAVGIATRAMAGDTALDACAQVAMAEAARRGGGRLVEFSEPMHGAALRRLRITQDLPLAAAAGQLALHYQPLMAADRSALTGFEALMRWTHPALGPVRPDEFIRAAEETGAILGLGDWAVRQAAAEAGRWRRACGRAPYIAVNISGRQLHESDVPALFATVLREEGLPPEALVAEVTETVATGDEGVGMLEALRRDGLRVAIDDFGAGFSSLGALRRLPADIVKFDRTLLPAGEDEGREARFFGSLVHAIRGLGFRVVAEGIETEAQWRLAAEAGADAVQGYGVTRPLPRDAATALVMDDCVPR